MPALSGAVCVVDGVASAAYAVGILIVPSCVPGGRLWVPWCLAWAALFFLCSKGEGGGRTQFLGLVFGVLWGSTAAVDALMMLVGPQLDGCQAGFFKFDLGVTAAVLVINYVALWCHRHGGNDQATRAEPFLKGNGV